MSKTKQEIVEHLKEAEKAKQLADMIATSEDINHAAAILSQEEKPEPGSPLAVKIAYIYGQMKRLPKSGYNEVHRYHFPLEGDVSDMLREQMCEQHIAFYPSMESYEKENITTSSGKPAVRIVSRFKMTLVDGDTGEKQESYWFGEAMDSSDKAMNKTCTSATKFYLLKTFLVSSGDDPDAGGLEIKGATKAPQSNGHTERPYKEKEEALRAAAKAKNMPWDPLVKYMGEHGTDAYSMSDSEANTWMDWAAKQRVRE